MSGEGPLILLVEDEPHMRRVLRLALESNGMRCAEAASAREAISQQRGHPPDVIVADLGLPDRDGIEVIRETRRASTVPIIVLSARSQEADKIEALDAGADDYVTKPFNAGELLARRRVAIRHAAARATASVNQSFSVRDLHVDLVHRRVLMRNAPVHLTPTESRLLQRVAAKAGRGSGTTCVPAHRDWSWLSINRSLSTSGRGRALSARSILSSHGRRSCRRNPLPM